MMLRYRIRKRGGHWHLDRKTPRWPIWWPIWRGPTHTAAIAAMNRHADRNMPRASDYVLAAGDDQ